MKAGQGMQEAPEPHVLHGLCFDRRKRRWKLRVMVSRGRKFIGKRICVHVNSTDESTAILARDAVLKFCEQLGLIVIRRKNDRPPRRRERREG